MGTSLNMYLHQIDDIDQAAKSMLVNEKILEIFANEIAHFDVQYDESNNKVTYSAKLPEYQYFYFFIMYDLNSDSIKGYCLISQNLEGNEGLTELRCQFYDFGFMDFLCIENIFGEFKNEIVVHSYGQENVWVQFDKTDFTNRNN